jgi:hypothetical protein
VTVIAEYGLHLVYYSVEFKGENVLSDDGYVLQIGPVLVPREWRVSLESDRDVVFGRCA